MGELQEFDAYQYKKHSMRSLLKLLVTDTSLANLYPNLKLTSVALVLPISTAECKYCISTMKIVKTELHNQLTAHTLDHLMRISLAGPAINDYDFDQAANYWGGMRQRRLSINV